MEQSNFSKKLRLAAGVATAIVVAVMLYMPIKNGDLDRIIESTESDKDRKEYIEEKYGNYAEKMEN